jgi:2-amino-4-hydroxy-6-hydroxymethyldihydropteridine diphosphokinase
MSTAVLSIGANVGDRLAALQGAADAHRPWLVAVSGIYETAPWGPVPQDDYLNAVLIVTDSVATPADWLARAQAAERAAGRVRDVRWGPRTLDVDVVDIDGLSSDDAALTLPHPRAAQRAFVLVPWLSVQPDARLGDRSIAALVAALPEDELAGVRTRPDLAVH